MVLWHLPCVLGACSSGGLEQCPRNCDVDREKALSGGPIALVTVILPYEVRATKHRVLGVRALRPPARFPGMRPLETQFANSTGLNPRLTPRSMFPRRWRKFVADEEVTDNNICKRGWDGCGENNNVAWTKNYTVVCGFPSLVWDRVQVRDRQVSPAVSLRSGNTTMQLLAACIRVQYNAAVTMWCTAEATAWLLTITYSWLATCYWRSFAMGRTLFVNNQVSFLTVTCRLRLQVIDCSIPPPPINNWEWTRRAHSSWVVRYCEQSHKYIRKVAIAWCSDLLFLLCCSYHSYCCNSKVH